MKQKFKIVVLEDEAVARLVEIVLRRRGHEVMIAKTPDDLKHRLVEEPFDWLILGAVLPGEADGYELLHHLQESVPVREEAVLILWAKSPSGAVDQEYRAGAYFSLSKPLNPMKLIGIIEGTLRCRKTR